MYDSHAHLDDPETTVPQMLALLAQLSDFQGAMTAGYGPERFAASRAICAGDPRIVRSVGLHPWWLVGRTEAEREQGWLDLLTELRADGAVQAVVAVGEIGLDKGLRERWSLEQQAQWFERGLRLSLEVRLPVVLHIVGWYGSALEILRRVAPRWRGVVHRWSGPPELVSEFAALGLHLSLSLEPRQNHAKRERIAKAVPRNQLLIETDWPCMGLAYPDALMAARQMLNQVAQWRDEDLASLRTAVYSNAKMLYLGRSDHEYAFQGPTQSAT